MKKYFVMTLVLVSFISAAQNQEKKEIIKPITKGNYLFGGFINYNEVKSSSVTSMDSYNGYGSSFHEEIDKEESNFNFSPNLGYFIEDGLAVGVGLPLSYSVAEVDGGDKTKSFSYGVSPFIKYYFKQGVFIEGHFGVQKINGESESNSMKIDIDGISKSMDLGLGYAFFVNSKVSIEPKFVYSRVKEELNYKANDNSYYGYGSGYGGYGSANQEPMELKTKAEQDGLYFHIGIQVFL